MDLLTPYLYSKQINLVLKADKMIKFYVNLKFKTPTPKNHFLASTN